MSSDFLLPGMFDELRAANASDLHIAGLDALGLATDPASVIPNDMVLTDDGPAQWAHEQLPQFGPPFVKYTVERLTALERAMTHALEKWSYTPTTQRVFATMQTTAAGGIDTTTQGNAYLVEPPPGMTFALHRIFIGASPQNFGGLYSNAGSWWELRINGQTWDGNSMVAPNGIPIVRTWGTRDALHVRDGEQLTLFMSGGPANTRIDVMMQGTFKRSSDA